MRTVGDSYETLSSENLVGVGSEDDAQTNLHKKSPFHWSCVQQSPQQDPPKARLSMFDHPLYSPGIFEDPSSPGVSRVSHVKFPPNGVSRLPFPLISLPEAAKLQHFRRERGEEDHSITGGSFMAKTRSGTVSTASSSQGPWTPLSPYFGSQIGSPHVSLPAPVPAHQRSHMADYRRATTGKFPGTWRLEDETDGTLASDDNTEFPLISFGVFDTPPSGRKAQDSHRSFHKGGPYDSWGILGSRLPSFLGLRNHKETQTGDRDASDAERRSLSSQLDPIESAREGVLHRRQFSDDAEHRQGIIFLNVMIFSFFFPPAGILALYGKFDSTISWYTHGQLHGLSQKQRGVLKKQLCAEVVVFTILIVTLAVYYSVHG